MTENTTRPLVLASIFCESENKTSASTDRSLDFRMRASVAPFETRDNSAAHEQQQGMSEGPQHIPVSL